VKEEQISVFSKMLILLPFHLILTSGPKLLAKNHQKVVFNFWMLFKAGFRYVKNMGNPYYELTIVVHDQEGD